MTNARLACVEAQVCCLVLSRSPKTVTDKLQRVMNVVALAMKYSNTKKFDRGLPCVMRHYLHWLDVSDCNHLLLLLLLEIVLPLRQSFKYVI